MIEPQDQERFIPYRRDEIIEMLCAEGSLNEDDQKKFSSFCHILESLYNFEFYHKIEDLKRNYFPFNPDKDTQSKRIHSVEELRSCENKLVEGFRNVLNNANYEEITQKDLDFALEEETLFKISLYVDLDDFEKRLIFWRGNVTEKVTVKKLLFKKEEIEVPSFERIAMLVKFKDAKYFADNKRKELMFEPGSMILKLFKNIPKSDLEMLFPNTQVRMRTQDKLMLGIPATLGGITILGTKGLAILAAIPIFITLLHVWLTGGSLGSVSKEHMALLIGAGTALGAILGYAWKQWDKYKNRKIQFMKTLSDNLYFKNLDNNEGVFYHLVDSAKEEECKEAILGYYFLLLNKEGLPLKKLDEQIEKWFEKKHDVVIDFEVDDAIKKLIKLELCTEESETYNALPLDKACERLDYIWDNYFTYNQS